MQRLYLHLPQGLWWCKSVPKAYQSSCHQQNQGRVLQILIYQLPERFHLRNLEPIVPKGLLSPVQGILLLPKSQAFLETAGQFPCYTFHAPMFFQGVLAFSLKRNMSIQRVQVLCTKELSMKSVPCMLILKDKLTSVAVNVISLVIRSVGRSFAVGSPRWGPVTPLSISENPSYLGPAAQPHSRFRFQHPPCHAVRR